MNDSLVDRMLVRYLRSPDHPMKRRIEDLILRAARKKTLRCTDSSGIRYDASPWEFVQSNILRGGVYEPLTLDLAKSLLHPGDVMVDVGANIGEFTLMAAKTVGASGRVISLEASPVVYEALRLNIEINGFHNIVPILVAAGTTDGIAKFDSLPAHNWGMNRLARDESNGAAVFVPRRPLAAVLRDCGVQRCDLLKIDVEGMESEVLRGVDFASPLRPRHIIVEYIPDLQTSADSLLSIISGAGYTLRDVRGAPFTSPATLPESNLWAEDENRSS